MKNEKPPQESKKLSDLEALVWAVVALIVLFFVAASISCQHGPKAPEPAWVPNVYLYSPDGGRCVFVNEDGHKIDCDEPIIHDHVLLPLFDMIEAKKKFQRCDTWK